MMDLCNPTDAAEFLKNLMHKCDPEINSKVDSVEQLLAQDAKTSRVVTSLSIPIYRKLFSETLKEDVISKTIKTTAKTS